MHVWGTVKVNLVSLIILHLLSLISKKEKKREAYIKYRSKEQTKTYDQPKIKVYTCATDSESP